ncbi:MAG TPA: DUF72 domain-containing protein [Actinomycetota bacterium]|nr:DUF72 domain-containing protein [Actinomycetota bacterium]
MSEGTIAVGTSGWSYDDWAGAFYPDEVPRSRWFDHYVTRFPTVEVNYSFYRLPSERTVARWHDAAPGRFRFAVKGSRFITHVRRLSDCQEQVDRFTQRVRGLRAFLGVVLWQLPPTLERDPRLLDGFLGFLPGSVRHAIEFRHRSWLTVATFDALRERGVAQVSVSSSQMPADRTETADFVYVRFHGLGGGSAHDYPRRELRPWARFLRDAHDRGLDGYVYFNNDAQARAPKNALELADQLGAAARPWPPEG